MREHSQKNQIIGEFSEPEKAGLHKALHERRDLRNHFVSSPISDVVLHKLFDATHNVGSVSSIVIRYQERETQFDEHWEKKHER